MRDLRQLGKELPGVARAAILERLQGQRSSAESPASADEGAPAPVFVTLRRSDGSLRGCIGSLSPTEPTVVAETRRSATLAATSDPRFSAVEPRELADLRIEVSVLMPAEPVASLAALDPKCFGVIVRDQQGRRGVLLPDIAGVEDAATQVQIARQKAGIPPGVPVELERFRVLKFQDAGLASSD